MAELHIGLMSGTSMDAVDAVLMDFSVQPPHCLETLSHPLPQALRHRLLALADPSWRGSLDEFGELDAACGRLFAEVASALLEQAGVKAAEVLAIGSHGQTVRHRPGGPNAFSLQIGDPNLIAELTGITTVADLRRRDIAAGGQGAPLVPAFHNAVFGSQTANRVILNIGGMANVTILPRQEQQVVCGFDTGPGNVLLDYWANQQLGCPFDEGGQWAATGNPLMQVLEGMLADPYFRRPPPKSTGREHFHGTWLQTHLSGRLSAPDSAADVQATLLELTARSISDAIAAHGEATEEVLVCGGGSHNQTLMGRLKTLMPTRRVASTATVGYDPDWIEAMAFAWLAQRTLQHGSGNLPSVTGADHAVILGGIYYGDHPHDGHASA